MILPQIRRWRCARFWTRQTPWWGWSRRRLTGSCAGRRSIQKGRGRCSRCHWGAHDGFARPHHWQRQSWTQLEGQCPQGWKRPAVSKVMLIKWARLCHIDSCSFLRYVWTSLLRWGWPWAGSLPRGGRRKRRRYPSARLETSWLLAALQSNECYYPTKTILRPNDLVVVYGCVRLCTKKRFEMNLGQLVAPRSPNLATTFVAGGDSTENILLPSRSRNCSALQFKVIYNEFDDRKMRAMTFLDDDGGFISGLWYYMKCFTTEKHMNIVMPRPPRKASALVGWGICKCNPRLGFLFK